MKKGILVTVLLLCFLPLVVLSQPLGPTIPRIEKTIKIPPETQKLYIWPSFDCVVMYESYPAYSFLTGEETGVIARDYKLSFLGKEITRSFRPEISKGPDFVCPIKLPADSTVSNVIVKGNYSGSRGDEEITVEFKVIETDPSRDSRSMLGSSEQRLTSRGDFTASINESFAVKGPSMPTYLWIHHIGQIASGDSSISYRQIVVSYR